MNNKIYWVNYATLIHYDVTKVTYKIVAYPMTNAKFMFGIKLVDTSGH